MFQFVHNGQCPKIIHLGSFEVLNLGNLEECVSDLFKGWGGPSELFVKTPNHQTVYTKLAFHSQG